MEKKENKIQQLNEINTSKDIPLQLQDNSVCFISFNSKDNKNFMHFNLDCLYW